MTQLTEILQTGSGLFTSVTSLSTWTGSVYLHRLRLYSHELSINFLIALDCLLLLSKPQRKIKANYPTSFELLYSIMVKAFLNPLWLIIFYNNKTKSNLSNKTTSNIYSINSLTAFHCLFFFVKAIETNKNIIRYPEPVYISRVLAKRMKMSQVSRFNATIFLL